MTVVAYVWIVKPSGFLFREAIQAGGITACPVTFTGGSGTLVYDWLDQGYRSITIQGDPDVMNWNAAAVLIDRLQDNPEECSRPDLLPRIVAYFQAAVAQRLRHPREPY